MMYLTREERLLPLHSIYNTRELGGYETQEGKFTRVRRYIRAAALNHLSEEDQNFLYDYGVRAVIDLRGEFEVSQAPDKMINRDVSYVHIDLFGDPSAALIPRNTTYHHMGELYCIMLDHLQPNIRQVFEVFYEHIDDTVLFHCSAGKDRTGVIAALLLDLAGCHEYDIVKDYSESYENNQPIYDELLQIARPENAHHLLSDPMYMMMFLDHLYENYGSAQSYLKSIGLDEEKIAQIKERFII